MIGFPYDVSASVCVRCLSDIHLDFKSGYSCPDCDSDLLIGFQDYFAATPSFLPLDRLGGLFQVGISPYNSRPAARTKTLLERLDRVYCPVRQCHTCETVTFYISRACPKDEIAFVLLVGRFNSEPCPFCDSSVEVGVAPVLANGKYYRASDLVKWFAWPVRYYYRYESNWIALFTALRLVVARCVPAQFCAHCGLYVLKPGYRVERDYAKTFYDSLSSCHEDT